MFLNKTRAWYKSDKKSVDFVLFVGKSYFSLFSVVKFLEKNRHQASEELFSEIQISRYSVNVEACYFTRSVTR